jgi:hypothetical protein
MTELDMTGLLLKLADLGVTGIKVHYAGSGDSGAIENVVYTAEKLSNITDEAFDEIYDLDVWGDDRNDLNDLSTELCSKVDSFVIDKLLNDIEDWWNDAGGEGDVCIIVPSGKYKINNQIYITTAEEFIHSGELIDKTLD